MAESNFIHGRNGDAQVRIGRWSGRDATRIATRIDGTDEDVLIVPLERHRVEIRDARILNDGEDLLDVVDDHLPYATKSGEDLLAVRGQHEAVRKSRGDRFCRRHEFRVPERIFNNTNVSAGAEGRDHRIAIPDTLFEFVKPADKGVGIAAWIMQ